MTSRTDGSLMSKSQRLRGMLTDWRWESTKTGQKGALRKLSGWGGVGLGTMQKLSGVW